MDVLILEPCPVPIVDLGTVPGDVFVKACIDYGDWLRGATKKEVDRLKSLGKIPKDFHYLDATPILIADEQFSVEPE